MNRLHRLLAAACLLACSLAAAAQPTLEQRVATLEDKEAIRTLLLDYGRYVDARDWDSFVTLFAPDGGTWDGGMGVARGRAAIRKMMVDSMGAGPNVNKSGSGNSNLHLFTNEYIHVDGDTASALSKWVFVMTAADGAPQPVFVGHYVDELVRIDGQWKFRNRKVLGDIINPATAASLDADAGK